jgi:hypothetical protein
MKLNVGLSNTCVGVTACIDLIGVDFSDEEAREKAKETGLTEDKCHNFVRFVVRKLYELNEKEEPSL